MISNAMLTRHQFNTHVNLHGVAPSKLDRAALIFYDHRAVDFDCDFRGPGEFKRGWG